MFIEFNFEKKNGERLKWQKLNQSNFATKTIIIRMSNVQILTLMPKKIEFLFWKRFKHASRAKNSSTNILKDVLNQERGHMVFSLMGFTISNTYTKKKR